MSYLKDPTIKDIRQLSDSGVVENLFKTHYASLCRTVFKIVKEKNTSEDIVQDVFVKMWNKREELDISVSIKSYLFRSAINTALNYIGQSKKLKLLEEEDFHMWIHKEVEQNIEFNEVEKDIQRAINGLPPACRTIFVLSRFEELSYKEIADTLELSIKTVENQMGKALKILRDKLQEYLITILMIIIFNFFF